MDKIKFLMTDTGTQTTQLCRQALEAKGIDVTVCVLLLAFTKSINLNLLWRINNEETSDYVGLSN